MLTVCEFYPQDGESGITNSTEEHKYEITESMRLEMEYNSDRAW